MSAPDPAAIRAIERAVAQAPGDSDLRVHLGELLLAAGRADEALVHVTVVLAHRPDDVAVLSLAESAAEASGNIERLASYRQMREALSKSNADAIETSRVADDVSAAPEQMTAPSAATDGETKEPEAIPLRLIDAGDDEDLPAEVERPRLTLEAVGGMEAVKKRLNVAFLAPMRNPQLREMYSKSLRVRAITKTDHS